MQTTNIDVNVLAPTGQPQNSPARENLAQQSAQVKTSVSIKESSAQIKSNLEAALADQLKAIGKLFIDTQEVDKEK